MARYEKNMDLTELAIMQTYKDLNRITFYILEYLIQKIDKQKLLKIIEEPLLLAPHSKKYELPKLPELMKELYDLIDNEAWAHVADQLEEIQKYLIQRAGENEVFD